MIYKFIILFLLRKGMIIINLVKFINLVKKLPDSTNRLYLIDEIRGFAIIFMVIYHLLFDLVYFFNVNITFFNSPFVTFITPWFSATFIFIAGLSCNYSHNNLKRGIKCLLYGLLMTIITFIVMPYNVYVFGVLHLLGLSMMIFHYIRPIVQKLNPTLGMIFAFLLMHITYYIRKGYLSLLWFTFDLPVNLYQSNFLFAIGLPNSEFRSSDYFPLLPWFWCFLAGSYLGVYAKEEKLPKIFYRSKPYSKLLATIGVNSLFIYMIHQPIIYLTLLAIFYYIN